MNDESRPVKAAPVSTGVPARTGAQSTAPAGDASRRRDRIKLLIGSMTTTTEKLGELLDAARAASDHASLGYASWTAYIAGEFSGSLAGLNLALRREVVGTLTETGMSTRAIAEVTDVSHSTVVRDHRQVVHDAPPAPDGPRPASEFKTMVSELGAPSRRRVTGTDGKSYSATAAAPSEPAAPPKRHRRPLPDAYRDAVYDLDKVVQRLARLHQDDRFPTNRQAVRESNRGRLSSSSGELRDLITDLIGGDAG